MNWSLNHEGSSLLSKIAFGDDTFVVVGSNGTVLQSDPLISLDLSFNGGAELSISGPVGRVYRIDYTELLPTSTWQTLATITATNRPQLWTDTQSTNVTQRFYRAVLLQ